MPNAVFKIQLQGIDELMSKLATLETTQLESTLKEAVAESATIVLDELQANTPVDTGLLRDSESITNEGLSASIGPDAEEANYGYWVEFGHHMPNGAWLPGQHFMERTSVAVTPQVQQIFQDKLKQVL